ncbi:MAG: HlyD family efflux transporter periplasmic adaptor subunit [Hellea sp.]
MYKLIDKFHGIAITVIVLALFAFIIWANQYTLDQVARTNGEVIASSRVQVIQSVDGGVLEALNVREGDKVVPGQILAKLDQTRIGASVKEIEARLSALKVKAIRLRAEVIQSENLEFPNELYSYSDLIQVESALFKQRQQGYSEQIKALTESIKLANEELDLVQAMAKTGDIQTSELLTVKKSLNEIKSKKASYTNGFFEEARTELTNIEDDIAQNEQILAQRKQQLTDSVFINKIEGIIKNVNVTTVGGVLRSGEELMQIIPLNDDLIIEVKIRPVDISMVRVGQNAIVRFDPFDYTIFGSTNGEVIYVSPDTLKEQSSNGEEIYYRAHVKLNTHPVITTAGKKLNILPGMTAQVDIRSGERTLMNYLLKPLKKTLTESFGER